MHNKTPRKIFNRHVLRLATVTTLLTWASVSYAAEWSLEDCLKQAEKASLSLQVSKLGEEQADVAVKNAKIENYPTVSANIGNTLYDSPFNGQKQDHYRFNMGLNGSLVIWDGGATSLSVESAQVNKQAASYKTELAVLQVRQNVLNAFFSLLAAKEKIGIANNALDLANAEFENDMKLFEAGSLTRRDLVLSQSDIAQKKVSVLTAEQSLDNAKTTLRQLLELERSEDFEIGIAGLDTLPPDSLSKMMSFDSLMTEVKKHYPALIADSLNVVSAEKNVKLAGKNSSVTVTLGANATTGFSAWQSDHYARQMKNGYTHELTLNIRIPIIDRGATTNKVLSAQITKAQAQISKQETAKSLENTIEQLYLNALAAEQQWYAATLQVEANTEALKVAEDQKSAGAITYTDYLQRKSDLESSKLTLTQAKYSSLLARALLDLYSGKYSDN